MKRQKRIAITFDDGPNGRYTAKILDILKKHRVKATFFLTGRNVEYYPRLTKRIAREGHMIGNHTYDHVDLTKKSKQQIKNQLIRTQCLIKNITGRVPKFFRPPYLKFNKLVIKIARELRLSIVLCDIIAYDWKSPGADAIMKRATEQIKNNSIILLHDGRNVRHNYNRSQTVKALPGIIKIIKEKGFNFVTLEKLKGKTKCLI